jgi:hypothetical protein
VAEGRRPVVPYVWQKPYHPGKPALPAVQSLPHHPVYFLSDHLVLYKVCIHRGS